MSDITNYPPKLVEANVAGNGGAFSLDSWGRFINTVGLPVALIGFMVWQLIPPMVRLIDANTAAVPEHAAAARDTADALKQIANTNSTMVEAMKTLTEVVRRDQQAGRGQ